MVVVVFLDLGVVVDELLVLVCKEGGGFVFLDGSVGGDFGS